MVFDLGFVADPGLIERGDRPVAPVDPQVHNRPEQISHHAKTRGADRASLPLVKPRLQGCDQPRCKRLAGGGLIILDHRGPHLIIGQQVAGSNHAIARIDGVDAERVVDARMGHRAAPGGHWSDKA
nr:hypothetical protein [Bradyrhizobium prioritasuperba]